MFCKQTGSGPEVDWRSGHKVDRQGGIAKPRERREHGIHASQRVRLKTSKRTQTEFCKVILDLSDIVLSYSQVVNQIASARLVIRRNLSEFAPKVPFERERGLPELSKVVNQLIDRAVCVSNRHGGQMVARGFGPSDE